MSTHEPNNPSVVDLVCGMTIDRGSAAGRSTYQGATGDGTSGGGDGTHRA